MAKRGKRVPDGVSLDYPLWEMSENERLQKGAQFTRYPSRMTSAKLWDYFDKTPEMIAGEKLFFHGGKMSDYGYKPKDDIDPFVAFESLIGILRGPDANHIQREATAALAIYNWYEKVD